MASGMQCSCEEVPVGVLNVLNKFKAIKQNLIFIYLLFKIITFKHANLAGKISLQCCIND